MTARRAALLFGPPLAFQALLFYLSSQQRLPAGPDGSDKVLHFVAYATLALLWIRALCGGGFAPTRGRALAAFAIATVFGLTDEFHQAFVPGRSASAWDLLADALGAASVAAFCRVRGEKRRGAAPQL